MTHWCPTCWRRYEGLSDVVRNGAGEVMGPQPVNRECWDCHDAVEHLWRVARIFPERMPAWMRPIARPWEHAA